MFKLSPLLRILVVLMGLVALLVAANPASAQVSVPHDWLDADHYARSPTHPYNIAESYDYFILKPTWPWMLPDAINYTMYAIKDASQNFIGFGRRLWQDPNPSLPANSSHVSFCAQQNLPVTGLPGVTVPGVLRQIWQLSPSPFGPPNFRLTVTCSGPIGSTAVPWFVYIFDNTDPLTATLLGVFKTP